MSISYWFLKNFEYYFLPTKKTTATCTRSQATVATYFRYSLMDLLTKMVASVPHFVRLEYLFFLIRLKNKSNQIICFTVAFDRIEINKRATLTRSVWAFSSSTQACWKRPEYVAWVSHIELVSVISCNATQYSSIHWACICPPLRNHALMF